MHSRLSASLGSLPRTYPGHALYLPYLGPLPYSYKPSLELRRPAGSCSIQMQPLTWLSRCQVALHTALPVSLPLCKSAPQLPGNHKAELQPDLPQKLVKLQMAACASCLRPSAFDLHHECGLSQTSLSMIRVCSVLTVTPCSTAQHSTTLQTGAMCGTA